MKPDFDHELLCNNLEQIVEDLKHQIIEVLEERGYKVKRRKWTG